MTRMLAIVWQLCLALCNRQKHVSALLWRQAESMWDSLLFLNCSFITPNMERKYSPGTEDFLVNWSRVSLPSLPVTRITGREDLCLPGLSGPSSAVERSACTLKSVRASSCQMTGMSCGCLDSNCCLSQGCFSSYSARSAFLGLETNLQKWSRRYSSCWSNI